jgi:hypothetical protein
MSRQMTAALVCAFVTHQFGDADHGAIGAFDAK